MLDSDQQPRDSGWFSRWSPGLRFWGVFGAVAVVLGLGVLVFREPLERRYHTLRAADYTSKAERFYEDREFTSAQLMLANSLRHDRERAATWRELARTLKAQGNSASVDALAVAWDLVPDDADTALNLLSEAAQARYFDPAMQRLPKIQEKFGESPEMLLGMAVVLQGTGDATRARDLLERALTLDPGAPPVRLALGGVLLQSKDVAQSRRGREMLLELQDMPAWRSRVRETLATAIATSEPNSALLLWRELQADAPGVWRYRLGEFDSRAAATGTNDVSALGPLWEGATNVMEHMAVLDRAARWGGLEAHQMFWEKLTPEQRRDPMLFQQHLQTLTERGAGKVAAQLVDTRLPEVKGNASDSSTLWLLRALAEKQIGETQLFHYSLQGALDACNDSPVAALTIARRLRSLGYDEESAPFLEAATRGAGRVQDLALRLLIERHQRRGDSQALLDCVQRQVKQDPKDIMALNNYAALLLLTGKQTGRALEIAADLYQQAPDDENFADTYAMALRLNGQTDKALEVFDLMKAAESPLASVRLHYALALAEAGRRDEALKLVQGLGSEGLLDVERRQLADLLAGKVEATVR